ncbi:hypothetical protein PCANC_09949 [Puccinia coronata f. sp. avenae]|uniref:Uncharacterized protein n=1 Tax=Puccinia coronata f. sp. avenae TaxID=200324 RepID=A0A2N5V2V6_9BASI|nr:hypothetical protein PCANC_09949 [Puccinia coronata f. sp. avenae]
MKNCGERVLAKLFASKRSANQDAPTGLNDGIDCELISASYITRRLSKALTPNFITSLPPPDALWQPELNTSPSPARGRGARSRAKRDLPSRDPAGLPPGGSHFGGFVELGGNRRWSLRETAEEGLCINLGLTPRN